MNPQNSRLHATISGRVQGVNFRWHTRETARRLGLVGWVRNRPDGTVETVAEGNKEKLDDFVVFLHQGPSMAFVDHVELVWERATDEFRIFSVKC
jgi:acylphosphatase